MQNRLVKCSTAVTLIRFFIKFLKPFDKLNIGIIKASFEFLLNFSLSLHNQNAKSETTSARYTLTNREFTKAKKKESSFLMYIGYSRVRWVSRYL